MRLAGTKLAANHQYRGFGDQLYDLSGQRPSLDLNFANSKSLVDATTGQNLVTFTRASTGTYVDGNGVLQSAATNVPRFDHNPTTGESLGLLVEEARTNLHLQSENLSGYVFTASGAGDILTNLYGTGADGLANKTLRAQTGAVARVLRWVSSDCGIDAISTQYCISFFYRGSLPQGVSARAGASVAPVVISPPVGTLMGRAYAVITSGTNGTAFLDFTTYANADGELWGVQVEKNASFHTSYIPTTTATATRSADVASISGSNFSGWYRQNEGTMFCSSAVTYTVPGSLFPVVASINDGTTNNRIENGFLTSSLAAFEVTATNVMQAAIYPTVPGDVSARRLVGAYAAGNFAATVNGSSVGTAVTGTIPTVDRLRIGDRIIGSGVNVLNGTIKRLTYWPTRLSNTTLQQITQP